MKLSRESGADGMIKRSSVIEQSHDEILWKKNVLGFDNPKSWCILQCIYFGKHFALRGTPKFAVGHGDEAL